LKLPNKLFGFILSSTTNKLSMKAANKYHFYKIKKLMNVEVNHDIGFVVFICNMYSFLFTIYIHTVCFNTWNYTKTILLKCNLLF